MKLIITFITAVSCLLQAYAATDPVCPVLGEAIPAGAPTVEYKGILLTFCCPGCDAKFLATPDKYLSQEVPEGKSIGEFLFDPVSHQRLIATDAKAESVYRGIVYRFSSEANQAEFAANPELYALSPDRESLFCPVMKKASATISASAGYADFEGVRYYFCCPGCDATFAQNPGKYAKSVSKHIRKAGGSGAKASPSFVPTCAGCAGEARLLGANGLPTRWNIAYRYINIDKDISARHRLTVDYAVNPRLSLGLERSGSDSSLLPVRTDGGWNWLRTSDGDAPVLPRGSWFITPEGPNYPSLVLGFTSDRLSTPKGQAFFLTAAKWIPGTVFTAFVSVKTNSYNGRTVMPFGVNTRLSPEWTLQTINDGDYTHVLLSHVFDWGSGSVILARSRYLGFGVSFGF